MKTWTHWSLPKPPSRVSLPSSPKSLSFPRGATEHARCGYRRSARWGRAADEVPRHAPSRRASQGPAGRCHARHLTRSSAVPSRSTNNGPGELEPEPGVVPLAAPLIRSAPLPPSTQLRLGPRTVLSRCTGRRGGLATAVAIQGVVADTTVDPIAAVRSDEAFRLLGSRTRCSTSGLMLSSSQPTPGHPTRSSGDPVEREGRRQPPCLRHRSGAHRGAPRPRRCRRRRRPCPAGGRRRALPRH